MKILMISSDRNVATPLSAVGERMKEYGALVEELHIVLMSNSSHGLKDIQIGKNVWVYPTNSITAVFRPIDAARLGKKIIFDKKFVRGQSVITADSIESGWAGMKVKNKWRLPLEVQLHTDPFSPYFTGFQNSVRKYFASKVLRSADGVRVVSESLRQAVAKTTGASIAVLPIFVDREKIEKGAATFDLHARYGWGFVLLSVARLSPEKNLEVVLEALAVVRKKYPNTGLVIVGSGPEERRLIVLAKKLNLRGFAEFAGWQDNLASYYKTANIFIQSSLFEGYGLALVEAGLSGLPAVSTPVGIAQELTDNQDLLIFPIGEPHILAQKIIELLESNQKRENLKFNMQRTLENKLVSKEEYLKKLQEFWIKTASHIA